MFVLCQPWETVAPSNQELFWLEVAQRSESHSFPFRKDLVTILISPSVRAAQHSEADCGQVDSPGRVHQTLPRCRKGRKRRGKTPVDTIIASMKSLQPIIKKEFTYLSCTLFFVYLGTTSGGTQGSLLVGSGDYKGCQGSNRGLPYGRQMSFQFCYCSSPVLLQ